ncbi:MAG: hypothetical protein ACR2N1_21050 [Rubripirellula sp.]
MTPTTRSLRNLPAIVLFALCSSMLCSPNLCHADESSPEADAALGSGDIQPAIDAYSKLADPSEAAIYNHGVAYYRNGELDRAAEKFRQVLAASDDSLAARARFNFGNTLYASALTKLKEASAPPEAPQGHPASAAGVIPELDEVLNQLRAAVTQYRSSLRLDRSDTDARANIELAQRLIEQIEKQQQDQQQQDQQQQDQQQQDQQQQDQQQQDQQQQDQQQQENTPDQKMRDSKDEADSEGEDDDSADPASGELTAVNEQEDAPDQERGEPALVNTDQMTEEEARKLLQSIRDRDMLRRLRKQAAERALRVPVERDW